jgi:hypothetical protein
MIEVLIETPPTGYDGGGIPIIKGFPDKKAAYKYQRDTLIYHFFCPQPRPNNKNSLFSDSQQSNVKEKACLIVGWKREQKRNGLAMRLMMNNFERRLDGEMVSNITVGVWDEVNKRYPCTPVKFNLIIYFLSKF